MLPLNFRIYPLASFSRWDRLCPMAKEKQTGKEPNYGP